MGSCEVFMRKMSIKMSFTTAKNIQTADHNILLLGSYLVY